jgi:hypothetical protein
LGVLDAGEAKVADFQITVLVNQNVTRFQIPMDHAGRVNIFQATLSKKLDSDPDVIPVEILPEFGIRSTE